MDKRRQIIFRYVMVRTVLPFCGSIGDSERRYKAMHNDTRLLDTVSLVGGGTRPRQPSHSPRSFSYASRLSSVAHASASRNIRLVSSPSQRSSAATRMRTLHRTRRQRLKTRFRLRRRPCCPRCDRSSWDHPRLFDPFVQVSEG
jgi:hypothetical protein